MGRVPAPAGPGPGRPRCRRLAARPAGPPRAGPGRRRRLGRGRPRRPGSLAGAPIAPAGAGASGPGPGRRPTPAPPAPPRRRAAPTGSDVEGDDGGAHVGHLAHHGGDAVGRAVVEEPPPPGGVAPPGQEHGALGVPVGHGVGHQLDGGPRQAPVGALDDVERQPGEPEPPPLVLELAGHLVVDVEVHRPQVVGRRGCGRTGWPAPWPGRGGRPAPSPRGGAGSGASAARGRPHLELLGLVDVLAVEPDEAQYMSGKSTTTTQAPWVNLATAKMSTTTPVSTAENPLMTTLRRQCAPSLGRGGA